MTTVRWCCSSSLAFDILLSLDLVIDLNMMLYSPGACSSAKSLITGELYNGDSSSVL